MPLARGKALQHKAFLTAAREPVVRATRPTDPHYPVRYPLPASPSNGGLGLAAAADTAATAPKSGSVGRLRPLAGPRPTTGSRGRVDGFDWCRRVRERRESTLQVACMVAT